MQTLYDKLGGKVAVELAVEKFYDKVLADNRINHFFANTDMTKQKAHQRAFLTYAFGGTEHYEGRSMQEAHQNLVLYQGLNETHFQVVVEDLVATLQELGISDELIAEVGAIAASEQTKRAVLSQN